MPPAQRSPARKEPAQANISTEIVDPVWLAKALAITLAVALLCAYLTACLLFYQGEWQLVLHPSHNVDRTPEAVGLPFTPVHFGDFGTGQPQLTAWWIPAQSSTQQVALDQPASTPRYSMLTVLYLHSGSGSLSDTLPMVTMLHDAGVNIFAIDYRGFGASDDSTHPDADRMGQDASAALDYLVSTQHVPAASIVPMGSGLGAALVVQLAHTHPELPAVILDNPDPDPATIAVSARPTRLIPVRLFFGSRFAVAAPLASLSAPKLLIAGGASATADASQSSIEELFQHAAGPKSSIKIPLGASNAALGDAFRRFLNEYGQGH